MVYWNRAIYQFISQIWYLNLALDTQLMLNLGTLIVQLRLSSCTELIPNINKKSDQNQIVTWTNQTTSKISWLCFELLPCFSYLFILSDHQRIQPKGELRKIKSKAKPKPSIMKTLFKNGIAHFTSLCSNFFEFES